MCLSKTISSVYFSQSCLGSSGHVSVVCTMDGHYYREEGKTAQCPWPSWKPLGGGTGPFLLRSAAGLLRGAITAVGCRQAYRVSALLE